MQRERNGGEDVGAGVVGLSKIADPGALLDPPSVSFGDILCGDMKDITVTVANVANTSQTFTITSTIAMSRQRVLLLRLSLPFCMLLKVECTTARAPPHTHSATAHAHHGHTVYRNSFSPSSLTLNPGSQEQFVVTFDSST